jgi:hypothetical protein
MGQEDYHECWASRDLVENEHGKFECSFTAFVWMAEQNHKKSRYLLNTTLLCRVLEFRLMKAAPSRLSACGLCLRACALFPYLIFPSPFRLFNRLWSGCKLCCMLSMARPQWLRSQTLCWNLPKFRLACVFQNLCFGLVGVWVVRDLRRGGFRGKSQIYGLYL